MDRPMRIATFFVLVASIVVPACAGMNGGSDPGGSMPPGPTDSPAPAPPQPRALQWIGAPQSCITASGPSTSCACSALVPEDGWAWSEAPVSPYWTATVTAGAEFGVWGILGIDRSMQGWYADAYGDLYAAPDDSMQYLANVMVAERGETGLTAWTADPQSMGDYAWRPFESQSFRGIVIFRLWDLATLGAYVDGQSYIENMYFTVLPKTAWGADWETVAQTTLSITCAAEISQQTGLSTGAESGTATLDSNEILGTEYYHDHNCTNYLVSYDEWSDAGPDGPGYYATVGGETEKLQPGRCNGT